DVAQIIDGRSERDRVDVRARTRFELPRKLVPFGELHRNAADHVTAVKERTHLLEYFRATPQAARARRREHLVAAERYEVRAEVLHVHRGVRYSLRNVHEDRRAGGTRLGRDLLDRVHGSEPIRGVRDRQELGALAQLGGELIAPQPAVVIDVDHCDLGPHLGRELLPGYEVGVVLEDRRHDAIAALDVVPAPRIGNEVQRLGRVANEDDLTLARRVDEARDLGAGFLEHRGRALAELVDAAVDIRVVLLEHLRHGVDHLPRLLTGR